MGAGSNSCDSGVFWIGERKMTALKKYYLVLATINCIALIVSIARVDSFGILIGVSGMIICGAGLATSK